MTTTIEQINQNARRNMAIGFARGRLKAARECSLLSLEEAVDAALVALSDDYLDGKVEIEFERRA